MHLLLDAFAIAPFIAACAAGLILIYRLVCDEIELRKAGDGSQDGVGSLLRSVWVEDSIRALEFSLDKEAK